jgi:hypothetical protein
MTTLPSGPRAAVRAGLLLTLLSVPPAAAAQPFGEGTHAFRAVLNQAGIKPLRTFDELNSDPKHTILIVLGDTQQFDREMSGGRPQAFLRAGGAVLIASDHRTDPALERELRIRVEGRLLKGPIERCFRREFDDCPFVTYPESGTIRAFVGAATRNALFQGLERIATNRPSYLQPHVIPGLPILAYLPAGCWFVQQGERAWYPEPLPFAAAGSIANGEGRLLLLADHSIFINDMMLQPDNDNIPFAANVARWLADPAGANRTAALFVEDGQIRTDFDVSLDFTEPPLPPIEALVPLADQALLALEREDFFNKALLRAVGRDRLLRTMLLVVTLGLLAYGLYAVTRSRFRTDPQVPRNSTAPAHAATPLALERRQAAQLRAGDLAEAAHELARQTLADLGASPHVTVTGSWWRRRAWGRRLRDLERVAAEGPWWRVTPRRLVRLAAELDELRQAVAAGTVRFGVPGRSA